MHLEMFWPCNPERVVEKLIEVKKQIRASEFRLASSNCALQKLTDDGRGLSKSEELEDLLERLKLSTEMIVRTHAASSHDREKWETTCRRLTIEIDHWKNEPVKDFVKQDDRFGSTSGAQPIRPLSKWYQDFYAMM